MVGSAQMKLYARRSSSNSQKVLWFLGELELEYEFIDTGGAAGGFGCTGVSGDESKRNRTPYSG